MSDSWAAIEAREEVHRLGEMEAELDRLRAEVERLRTQRPPVPAAIVICLEGEVHTFEDPDEGLAFYHKNEHADQFVQPLVHVWHPASRDRA